MRILDLLPPLPKRLLFTVGTALVAGATVGCFGYLRHRRHRIAEFAGPVTPGTIEQHAAEAHMGTPGSNVDERLDEALQETFPTSDPVSILIG